MTDPHLTVESVAAGYRGRRVVRESSLEAARGSLVSLFGHNGAGKTTLLRAICGSIPIMGGTVAIGPTPMPKARGEVAIVPQGKGVFSGLSIRENLALGVWRTGKRLSDGGLEPALQHFPALRDRLDHDAGVLSGGQRQMVSIARALLTEPSVLLLDEPSVGLAPNLVENVLTAVRELVFERNIAAVLVEQNVRQALRVSDYVYVMKSGRIVSSGEPEEFSDQERLWQMA